MTYRGVGMMPPGGWGIAVPLFEAYHDVDAGTHQSRVTQLSAQGYHPISLCVYGDPGSPLYAAVWVQEPTAPWIARHGLSGADYQAWITGTVQAQGYSLRLVSATGPVGGAVFAAVAEQTGALWDARHDVPDSDLRAYLDQRRDAGMVPLSISAYGSPGAPAYAVACQAPADGVQWNYPDTALSAQDWQNSFDAHVRTPSRPSALAVTPDSRYVGVFRNDSLGPEIVRHGLSSGDYQTAFNTAVADGFIPVAVAAGGPADAIRFAAAFARRTTPLPRSFMVTGPAPVPALAGIDAIVESFMRTYGVRAGQVAVAHGGVLAFARAFTWGEPGYPITTPASLMRIASCSKAFTCGAVDKLVTDGQLRLDTPVFPLLGITAPGVDGQTPDPDINKITVDDLVKHLGGWNDGARGDIYVQEPSGAYTQVPSSGVDPVFGCREIAVALNLPCPPSKRDIAAYMYGQPLQFRPGTQVYSKAADGSYRSIDAYSNVGYVLLGLVVEAVSGLPFVDYLRQAVLSGLGLNNLALSRMMAGPVSPNEVGYDEPNVGPTPFDGFSNRLVPAVLGGEGLLTELCDAAGGLMTDASTMALFAHTHAVWGLDGRSQGYTRTGSEAGCSSLMDSPWDDVDWAFVFNTRWSLGRIVGKDATGADQSALDKLTADIKAVIRSAWP